MTDQAWEAPKEPLVDDDGALKKEPEQEPELPPNKRAARGFYSGLIARLPKDRDALAGGSLIKRRRVSFVMDGSACAPGFFADESGEYMDFEVTLQSLDHAEEINAYKTAKSQGQIAMELAKHMLCEIEGEPITEETRDLIWEGMGMRGRALCSLAMQAIASVGAAELGKYRATFSVS